MTSQITTSQIMMTSQWILSVTLLVLLTPDLFPSRPSLTHAAPSAPPPATPHQILFITGVGGGNSDHDYDDHDYTDDDGQAPPPSSPPSGRVSTTTAPSGPAPVACGYDPCLEQQTPCAQLSAQHGCLCPGLSGASEPPRPPRLRALVPSAVDGGVVEAQWCAPESEVEGYRVVVEGGAAEVLTFGEERRRAALGEGLEAGARVCVEAVNGAGVSAPSDESCMTYDPPESGNLALRAGVLGGGAAFLLMLSLAALALWRRGGACGRAGKDDSTTGGGLGNPSYSAGGTL